MPANDRTTRIHPTAIVHPSAQLGQGVTIGPYAIVNEDVVIGDHCIIGPRAIIDRWTVMGKRNKVYAGAVVGNEPMDLKFNGEETQLIIGDDNMIREYATISRGTIGGGGVTRIGNGNLIMSNVHVAHDVQMGDGIVISHGSGIAGHVIIEDRARIGGIVGVHQFTRIGALAMVGAHSMVTKDVPPYVLVNGDPAKPFGVNIVGLRRNEFPPDLRLEIQKAYKILYRSGYNVTQAIEEMERVLNSTPEIEHFLRFLRNAERGICR